MSRCSASSMSGYASSVRCRATSTAMATDLFRSGVNKGRNGCRKNYSCNPDTKLRHNAQTREARNSSERQQNDEPAGEVDVAVVDGPKALDPNGR